MSKKIGVSLNLNLSNIDKSALFQGQKGTYLNLSTFINLDEKDQYDNNGFVVQDLGKERREEKGPIIGNVRVFWTDEASSSQPQAADDGFADDDLPF